MKTIAIHQPNYLPWLGYFNKISQSDVFVILDDVDYQHGNASSLTNRTRLKGLQGPFWLTVPVKRKNPSALILDILIDQNGYWQKKQLKTLFHVYGKTRYFSLYIEQLESILNRDFIHLAVLNTELIRWLCSLLEIQTQLVLSGELNIQGFTRDEKIAQICLKLGGTQYLSGSGARKYNRPEVFAACGIELTYTNFIHPRYPQDYGPFIPGLSILDVLFNCGPETKSMLNRTT